MESAPKSAPWHQSMTVLMIATLLLPPLGLVMLWMRKDSGIGKKIFASFAILALVASYLFFAYSHGLFARRDPNMEGHYDELERQRAEQRAATQASSMPTSSADPKANAKQCGCRMGEARSLRTSSLLTLPTAGSLEKQRANGRCHPTAAH